MSTLEKKDELPLLRLNVFPNTGHHYFTRRLTDLFCRKGETSANITRKENELLVQVKKLIKDNPDSQLFMPWDATRPWLRYRLETPDEKPYITIAVESNLGNLHRGTLYEVHPCGPEPEIEPFFPYAQETLKDPFIDHIEKVTDHPLGDLNLEICFNRRRGPSVDVDLIVDLGNSRTAAVLLEKPSDENKKSKLSNRLRVLKIGPRGTEARAAGPRTGGAPAVRGPQDDFTEQPIIDSWFLLHETIFAHLEPGRPGTEARYVLRDAKEYYLEQTKQKAWLMSSSMPHVFVELSPALIGGGKSKEGAARIFSDQNLEKDYPFYLSSPKRYSWSLARCGRDSGSFWHQIPNPSPSAESKELLNLHGLIRHFMATDGHDLNTDAQSLAISALDDVTHFQNFVHTAPPTYSKSDAIVWFALSLLEAAYRQINSNAYIEGVENNGVARRLRYVRVTCPSGWTFQERELYFRQWQRAINLFTMSRFENWNRVTSPSVDPSEPGRPVLCFENLDEAVCSQLPVLYAEIQSFSGQASKWIELYGRGKTKKDPNDGKEKPYVVVMNLDIGGGTTDLAIIEYMNVLENEVRIRPNLLFRDGYQFAGDMVVKKIVEQVLIPAWFAASVSAATNPVLAQARGWLELLFREPSNDSIKSIGGIAATASKRLARIIRLVFMPLANLLLKELCDEPEMRAGQQKRPGRAGDRLSNINIRECMQARIFDLPMLADLNQLCTRIIHHFHPHEEWGPDDHAFSPDVDLHCDLRRVEKCVDEVFSPLFSGLSGLVASYNCDVLIVSGKPSELPRLHKLLREHFPLLPQRIIRVKDYPAGDWYPSAFSVGEDRRITDAKTCTVVGAALYQDFKYNQIPGFSIVLDSPEPYERKAYWGVIPQDGPTSGFFNKANLLFHPLKKKEDYPNVPNTERPDCLVRESDPRVFDLTKPARIGRQLVKDRNVQPAPVYRLLWNRRDTQNDVETADAEVVFRWVSVKGKGDMLEIARVTPIGECPLVEIGDLRLELNTLMPDIGSGEEFWLDDPRLNVTL